MRLMSLWSVILATVALPAAASGRFAEADAAALAIKLVSQPASYESPARDAFTLMAVDGRCSRTVLQASDVELRWEVKREGVESHRVDISEFADGFAKGRYLTSGDLPGSEREIPFQDARPGLYYYWRLLTKTSEGWIVSGTGRFDAPICPADMVPE